MANIIDGKQISTDIKNEVQKEVIELKDKGIEPCLAVILVGENPPVRCMCAIKSVPANTAA